MNECGCKVEFETYTDDGGCDHSENHRIIYCPLHSAAPQLLKYARRYADFVKDPQAKADILNVIAKATEGQHE